jgi:hypothetical protein
MNEQFDKEPENLVVLFYFCLTCLLTKRIVHCRQVLTLMQTIHKLTYKDRSFIVLDYYLAKARNIDILVSGLERQMSLMK